MPGRLTEQPLFVLLTGIMGLAMAVPGAYALAVGDMQDAQAFLGGGGLVLTLAVLLGLALGGRTPERQAREDLLSLLLAFSLLPLVLAFPFQMAVGNTRLLNAFFEMASSLTTTGATVFPGPDRLSGAEHLWRALVGWIGGFMIWVAAAAILAPMKLGGFEVLSPQEPGQGAATSGPITRVADTPERLSRYAVMLAPIYGGLTLALWIGLIILGDGPLVAICHAMSTLATSGISPVGGQEGAASGVAGEAVIFVFLFFAISRQTFTREKGEGGFGRVLSDHEFRMGVMFAGVVPLFLFLRHWVGAFEVDGGEDLPAAASALWGAIFTVLSFLSTTGFVSVAWDESQSWSGLATPGLLLMGLALIGGGVATTAGGVKLLRVYALYRHGARELERLVHPSSVGGAGANARRIRREGAYVAWIFFMLFAISIAAVMLALAAAGIDFETAVILTIAALSTTGPLAEVAGAAPIAYATLSDAAKLILVAAMVLGRLETLAIIALLNPDFWRN
ncbi:MAG: TrkH family potassium uptake protein [Paracoccaceae bacterium]